MPMKWTPDKDQLMFMMLLKTHNISINYGAIAQAWPDDQGEKPTPRAISERLIKMRKLVSAGSNGSAAAVKPRSVNSTPSKPKPVRAPISGGTGTPSNKRRRVDYDNDDDRTISRQELRELGIANRISPTPRPPPAPTTAAPARRHSTVASTVLPTSETSPPRTLGNNGQAPPPPSRVPTASARPSAAPPVTAATAAQRALSANAHAFAARTPVSMTPASVEPTAGLARLSVTPGSGSVRPTPRRGTSVLAPIKLEDSADDDDALQACDFEDDSDVSDWAEEV